MSNLKINVNKINVLLSTLNFVLCFVGYQLITTIFLPTTKDLEGISGKITIPYRAVALLISLLVIWINFKIINIRFSNTVKIFLFYWIILIIRIIYDINFGTAIDLKDTTRLWFYVFGICIPAVFSLIKSYNYINLNKAFWWILGITGFILIVSLFLNQMLVESSQLESRQEVNSAFNSITYGHFGVTGIILSIFALLKYKLNLIQKSFVVFLILLGIYCMIRAGSRGPFIAFIIVIFFWIFSYKKNLLVGLFGLIVVSLISVLFVNQILDFIGTVSPIFEERLKMSIYSSDDSGRDGLFAEAIKVFFEYPIFGKQFAIITPNGNYIYSHNIFLDTLMGLGIVGGVTMMIFLSVAFIKSYFVIKYNKDHYWICLILIQNIIGSMFSGCFYLDPLLSVLFLIVFFKFRDTPYLKLKRKTNIVIN